MTARGPAEEARSWTNLKSREMDSGQLESWAAGRHGAAGGGRAVIRPGKWDPGPGPSESAGPHWHSPFPATRGLGGCEGR
jgi:hypothetical protein